MRPAFNAIGAALFVTALVTASAAEPKLAPKPTPKPIGLAPTFSCAVSNAKLVPNAISTGTVTITKSGGGALGADVVVTAKIKGPKLTLDADICTSKFAGTPQRASNNAALPFAPADWIYTCTASQTSTKCPVETPAK